MSPQFAKDDSGTVDQNALTKYAALSIIKYEENIGEKLAVR